MGYKNEFASRNNFNSLKKYYNEKIKSQLMPIVQKNHYNKQKLEDWVIPYSYIPKKHNKPCVAFDGGIAILFANEILETKILKVSAGFSTSDAKFFNNDYQESIIHIFTGKYKWIESLGSTLPSLAEESVKILLENDVISKALKILQIDEQVFKNAVIHKIIKFKGKSLEDNIREIFELSSLVLYNEKLKKQYGNQELNYLIIKDGTLFPSAKTVTSIFAEKINLYLNNPENNIVGVVKNSRFLSEENPWTEYVNSYIKKDQSTYVYRLPEELSNLIDEQNDRLQYYRYFLSILSGQAVFEVQLSKSYSADMNKVNQIFDVLSSQISLQYGGSIITNSYAHEKASLSESEALYLTKEAKEEIKQYINQDENQEDFNE